MFLNQMIAARAKVYQESLQTKALERVQSGEMSEEEYDAYSSGMSDIISLLESEW